MGYLSPFPAVAAAASVLILLCSVLSPCNSQLLPADEENEELKGESVIEKIVEKMYHDDSSSSDSDDEKSALAAEKAWQRWVELDLEKAMRKPDKKASRVAIPVLTEAEMRRQWRMSEEKTGEKSPFGEYADDDPTLL